MADFSATISTLEQQRRELLDQVAAIDRAIAALSGTDRPYRPGAARAAAAPNPAPSATPKRKKRQFALSEDHKRTLLEGQQRAREKRMAAESTAAETAVPPVAWPGAGAPRLVKTPPES